MTEKTLDKAIELIKSNSGYDRNTPTWEAQRALVEYAERGSIYMIEHSYETYGNSGYYWDRTLDEDHGFFLTREEAQSKVDEYNNYEGRYDKYVQANTAHNVKAMEQFARRQEDHEKAKAAGLSHLAPAPVRADTRVILDFDGWKAHLREDSYYSVVEVNRA
jgi:hypothetical protein